MAARRSSNAALGSLAAGRSSRSSSAWSRLTVRWRSSTSRLSRSMPLAVEPRVVRCAGSSSSPESTGSSSSSLISCGGGLGDPGRPRRRPRRSAQLGRDGVGEASRGSRSTRSILSRPFMPSHPTNASERQIAFAPTPERSPNVQDGLHAESFLWCGHDRQLVELGGLTAVLAHAATRR